MQTIRVKMSETWRDKPEGSRHTYRYAKCECGRKLNIGSAREVERGDVSEAECAKCGAVVRIAKS